MILKGTSCSASKIAKSEIYFKAFLWQRHVRSGKKCESRKMRSKLDLNFRRWCWAEKSASVSFLLALYAQLSFLVVKHFPDERNKNIRCSIKQELIESSLPASNFLGWERSETEEKEKLSQKSVISDFHNFGVTKLSR